MASTSRKLPPGPAVLRDFRGERRRPRVARLRHTGADLETGLYGRGHLAFSRGRAAVAPARPGGAPEVQLRIRRPSPRGGPERAKPRGYAEATKTLGESDRPDAISGPSVKVSLERLQGPLASPPGSRGLTPDTREPQSLDRRHRRSQRRRCRHWLRGAFDRGYLRIRVMRGSQQARPLKQRLLRSIVRRTVRATAMARSAARLKARAERSQ